MSYEASGYRRSSGSRYREREERDSYRRSRHREESRRSEKYHHHEERRGRYSSSRRRSPSEERRERRRERSRDRYRYSDSRSRSRSPREHRRRRRDSYSPAASPPSPPKFSHAESPKREQSDSEDDTFQRVERRSDFGGTPKVDISEEFFEDIEANKEKIHQAMEERLRQHLAAQGKVYPPPKPEPQQTTMFANDGSFMEMFKRMQEQQEPAGGGSSAPPGVKKTPAPLFGKRRGGKILKTGIVEKKKPVEEPPPAPGTTDAWSLYMAEVKKYKNFSCDIDSNSRPLVK